MFAHFRISQCPTGWFPLWVYWMNMLLKCTFIFSTLKMAAWGSGPLSGSAQHTTEVLTHGYFEQQKVCPLCMHSSHANALYHSLFLMVVFYRCLSNPCQSDIWWLTTARRNFYQAVLIRIYHDCAIMEAWLPFMTCRIWTIRTWLSGCMKFSVHDNNNYVNCGAIVVIASTVYATIMELSDELPAPSPNEMTVTIDLDNNINIEWHNINGSRKKHQSLLLREIGSSSPTSCSLSCYGMILE